MAVAPDVRESVRRIQSVPRTRDRFFEADRTVFEEVSSLAKSMGRTPEQVQFLLQDSLRVPRPRPTLKARIQRRWSRAMWFGKGIAFLSLGSWWQPKFFERRARQITATLPPSAGTAGMASIVIVSYNRQEYLAKAIRSVRESMGTLRHELIVVDNGSTDGCADFLVQQAAAGMVDKVILMDQNYGTSVGFNYGFAYADPATDYYVKLDGDIRVLCQGWLPHFEALFRKYEHVGVLALDQMNHAVLRMLPYDTVDGLQVKTWERWIAGSACMTIPRRVFEKLGYFNEDYKIKLMPDDGDYFVRLRKLGYRAYYVRNLPSYHQIDLDNSTYRDYARKKHEIIGYNYLSPLASVMAKLKGNVTEWTKELRRLKKDQDSAGYKLYRDYPHYRGLTFPPGERVIRIRHQPAAQETTAASV